MVGGWSPLVVGLWLGDMGGAKRDLLTSQEDS